MTYPEWKKRVANEKKGTNAKEKCFLIATEYELHGNM